MDGLERRVDIKIKVATLTHRILALVEYLGDYGGIPVIVIVVPRGQFVVHAREIVDGMDLDASTAT